MEVYRVTLISLFLAAFMADRLAATTSCSTNEQGNPTATCQITCNACQDCGPCICKSGYTRKSASGDCISEADCHKLHFTWSSNAKKANKTNTFFNCLE